GDLSLMNATQNQRLTVFGGEVRLKVSRIKNSAAKHNLARHHGGRFGVNFQLHVSGAVDVRGDFQNDAHVLVGEILAVAANRGIVLAGENRHLLADEQSSGFVVVDIDLRFAENGRVRVLLEK